jgi:hypothetical protein
VKLLSIHLVSGSLSIRLAAPSSGAVSPEKEGGAHECTSLSRSASRRRLAQKWQILPTRPPLKAAPTCYKVYDARRTWGLECARDSHSRAVLGEFDVCELDTLWTVGVVSTCRGGVEAVAGLA